MKRICKKQLRLSNDSRKSHKKEKKKKKNTEQSRSGKTKRMTKPMEQCTRLRRPI